MKLLINRSTNPAFNLALEEYALTQMKHDIIILWRNLPSVIIGCNQNAVEEMDLDYIQDNNITVIRRLSGGGAVFHDLGNINFTVIHELGKDDFSNYQKFTAPICDFLQSLGVDARLQGRNDLTIDGMKFSGNAQAVKNNRIMHHGTILFNADVDHLAGALKPNQVKIESKGVKSVRSRVTNVADHLPVAMSVEEFFNRMAEYFRKSTDSITEYVLTPKDLSAVSELVDEKYGSWEWNFGKSPDYNYERIVRFSFGIVDLRLTVTAGIMEQVNIFGDFFGIQDKAALEQQLSGVRHYRDDISHVLERIDLNQYIHGITVDEFLDLF